MTLQQRLTLLELTKKAPAYVVAKSAFDVLLAPPPSAINR